jgi:hypothetical protein
LSTSGAGLTIGQVGGVCACAIAAPADKNEAVAMVVNILFMKPPKTTKTILDKCCWLPATSAICLDNKLR